MIATMTNRLTELFDRKKENVLNIYFTAGYPKLEDTVTILKALEKSGVDLIEIGMPYSDPIADGPVIQKSGEQALINGMTIKKLFAQLEGIRKEVSIPITLMGYLNPVLQYGMEAFLTKCGELGIDGLILPDLPMQEYLDLYKDSFEKNNVSNVFLVTPQTDTERLQWIDSNTNGFIYVVSTNSTTGNEAKSTDDMLAYFERIKASGLESPTLIGFNIKDNATYTNACKYANGAIIGSAFIKALDETRLEESIEAFVKSIR